jgi:dipeptidyl aminopeptidase/acylaminoacyl peptidase
MRPLIALCAAVLATAATGPAWARQATPFTVDDLLSLEDVGRARFSPDGRRFVLERRAAWGSAAGYDLGHYTAQLLTALELRDGRTGALVARLDDPGHAAGYLSGPISPDGGAMVVYRLTRTSLRLGVLSLDTGAVRWFAITPEWPVTGRTVAWRAPNELIILARPLDDLPLHMRVASQAQRRSTALWEAAANGHVATPVVHVSGRDRDQRAQPIPGAALRLRTDDGRIEVLDQGEFVDLELSPDGRTAAAVRQGEDVQPRAGEAVLTGTPSRRRRLVLIDLDHERAPVQVDADLLPYQLAWRADSSLLLISSRAETQTWREAGFATVDRQGLIRSLDAGARPAFRINTSQIPWARAAWDGDKPVVLVEGPEDRPFWRRLDGVDRFTDLHVPADTRLSLDRRGRLLLADGTHWRTVEGGIAGERSSRGPMIGETADLGGRGAVHPSPNLAARGLAIDDQGCLRPSHEVQTSCAVSISQGERLLAAANDGRAGVLEQPESAGSGALLLRTAKGDRVFDRLNPWLTERQAGDVRRIDWTDVDGQSRLAWILLPPNRPAHDLPVVLMIYPGNVHPTAPASLQPGHSQRHINASVLAAAGYAVVVPSLPLDRSDGQALVDLGARLERVLEATARDGLVDPDRAAVLGHSYGGIGALAVATQTGRFRAIVASAANADYGGLTLPSPAALLSPEDGPFFATGAGWAETGQGRIGATITGRPDLYVASSSLYAADRIWTPTLLIDGELDHSRGSPLFGALWRLDHEAELAIYVGEGHVFASPANIRDLHARIVAWLDRWLSPPALTQARLPTSGPALYHGREGRAATAVVPDQSLRRQDGVEASGVNHVMARQPPLEQERP